MTEPNTVGPAGIDSNITYYTAIIENYRLLIKDAEQQLEYWQGQRDNLSKIQQKTQESK